MNKVNQIEVDVAVLKNDMKYLKDGQKRNEQGINTLHGRIDKFTKRLNNPGMTPRNKAILAIGDNWVTISGTTIGSLIGVIVGLLS